MIEGFMAKLSGVFSKALSASSFKLSGSAVVKSSVSKGALLEAAKRGDLVEHVQQEALIKRPSQIHTEVDISQEGMKFNVHVDHEMNFEEGFDTTRAFLMGVGVGSVGTAGIFLCSDDEFVDFVKSTKEDVFIKWEEENL